ncbi:MAG TPA: hypothetical protein VFO82_01170 [Steroidobacteraceae bacterium]|nr:hypothetical protein [Steroidobacteraceae bacterium]
MATVAALERLALEAAVHGRGAPHREIARATGGLPVYADLGGGLAVKSNGKVVGYSWESREVQEAGADWSRLAIARLVREHPAFAELLPERPDDAENCAACSGTGIMMANFDCGHCLALGWVARRG